MADQHNDEGPASERLWWGTTASSVGTEGATPASTWARWEDLGNAPRSGEGNAFATNYARDFSMLAEHGITHHRLTVEWARIEPRPGTYDNEATDRYLDMVQVARDHGIAVWICLHHFSLPGWFADDEGGFLDDRGRTYFWPRHVDRMGEIFGDLAAGWVPIDRPHAYAEGGWSTGELPPGRRDPSQFLDALQAVYLASYEAWRQLRSSAAPVATSLDLSLSYPAVHSREPDEREAAVQRAAERDALVFHPMLAALREGALTVPGKAVIAIPDFAGAFNVVGFRYDNARSVYADGTTAPYPADARVGPLGQAPWPEGLGIVLRRLHDQLPDRRLLPEISVVTPASDPRSDGWRAELLRAHALEVGRAVQDGIDVAGCWYDTAVDGYEWAAGFDVQRGLFDRDRRPKPSARALQARATSTGPQTTG